MKTGNRGSWTGTAPITYVDKWQVSTNGTTWSDVATGSTFSDELMVAHAGKFLRFATTATNEAGSATAYSPSMPLPNLSQTMPVPVVTADQAFSLSEAATIGQTVGPVLASNSPTSFAIVGGTGASFFTVSTGGQLKLAKLLDYETAVTQTLMVTATNAAGTSLPVAVTVNVTDEADTGSVPTYPLDNLPGALIAAAGEQITATGAAPFYSASGAVVTVINDQLGTAANIGTLGSAGNAGTVSYKPSISELANKPGFNFNGSAYMSTAKGTFVSPSGDILLVANIVRRTPKGAGIWEVLMGVHDNSFPFIYDGQGCAVVLVGETVRLVYGGSSRTSLPLLSGASATIALIIKDNTAQLFVDDVASPVLTTFPSAGVTGWFKVGGTVDESNPYGTIGPDRANADVTHIFAATNTAGASVARAYLGGKVSKTVAGGLASAWAAYLAAAASTPPETSPVTTPTNPAFLAETLDTDPGPAAGASTLPTTFVLENWSTSSSIGMARIGMPFARGDIPAGKIPAITRDGAPVAAQFDERAYWLDGSLKFCVAHLRDADFPALTSRTYTVSAVTGSYSNAGSKQLSDITGGHDFKVNFASLTETGSTTTTVGSGAFTASFNSHSAVATRREKYHSGAVTEGWYAWGMAKDNNGGAEDAHLKANWYVDVWKNADGSIYAYEVAAVLAQDWWSVANKKRRNYNVSLNDGATTIEAYSSVEHIYKSQWITCQNRGGNNRGKPHWVGGAQPTLTYKPSKTYWRNTKLIAPYDASFTPAAYSTSGNDVYTPCKNQNHRPNIDGTGAYEGRGVNSNPDVVAFMRQDAASVASMRINAHVGLHVYYHMRSNANRVRPGETADVANTPLSLKFEVGSGPAIPYDFTADGMPAPGHAYADSRADTAHKNGYVDVQGGGGVWSNTTGDSSHACNYSGFAYMLEGERYHLEATMDLASYGVHQGIGNEYMGTPYSAMAPVASGTGGKWDAIVITGQQRNAGFAMNLIGFAAAFAPSTHIAKNYFNRFNRQQGRFLKNALDFMPANIAEVGLHLIYDAAEHSPWMTAMSAIGIRQNGHMTENGYAKLYADHIAKPSIRMGEKHVYRSGLYRADYLHRLAAWDPTTNPFNKDGTMRGFSTVNSTNSTLTAGTDFTQSDCGWDKWTNGDIVYFFNTGDPLKDVLHSNEGTPLYAVNSSGNTCQLSLTPGGAPITIPVDTHKNGTVFIAIDPQWTDAYTATQFPPKLYGADSYAAMHRAVVVMANFAGQPEATAAKVQKYNTFLAPVNSSNWLTWKMAA